MWRKPDGCKPVRTRFIVLDSVLHDGCFLKFSAIGLASVFDAQDHQDIGYAIYDFKDDAIIADTKTTVTRIEPCKRLCKTQRLRLSAKPLYFPNDAVTHQFWKTLQIFRCLHAPSDCKWHT